MPHKRAVAALCDDLTTEAGTLGAVNTFWWDDDALLHGDNTDVAGLARDLADMAAPAGPAVVLGPVVPHGPRPVLPDRAAGRNGGRRATAADDVAPAAGGGRRERVALVDESAVAAAVDAASLLVNATPLGMEDESLPSAVQRLRGDLAVYDCVYRPQGTPLVAAARASGAPARDGRGMLLGQAVAAAPRWTGQPAPADDGRGPHPGDADGA